MTITFLLPVKVKSQESDTGSTCIRQLWKSHAFNFNIHGIAVGDVDNDTKTDVLILTEKKIQMHHFKNGKLSKGSDIYKIRLQFPIGIDIADINKNGFPEIFVTAFNTNKKSIISFVIEYNGKEFKLVNKNLPWYFRAVSLKDTVPVLFGQKHRKNTPFKRNVFKLKWSDTTYTYTRRWGGFGAKGVNAERAELKKYIPCNKIAFSIDMNAMGLAYGDIMNNGQNVVVAYDKSNKINMLDTDGKKIWESPEKYGGSTFYHQHESKSPASQGEREYLPMRIQIGDINSDGTHEIIAIKNYEITRNLFDKFKLYKEHQIELITWDGYSFNTYCNTGIIYGFVRDFAISDLDNDGTKELITVLVIREGKSVFRKAECYLAAYHIN